MSFCNTMTAGLPAEEPFFKGWDEILRWLDIARLIFWIWRLIQKALVKNADKSKSPSDYSTSSISRNEFGYIDYNGAY